MDLILMIMLAPLVLIGGIYSVASIMIYLIAKWEGLN